MSIQNNEPIWFNQKETKTENKYSKFKIFIATPCHSELSIHYTQSLLELQKLGFKEKIPLQFQIFKSSLVTQGRNLSVSAFLNAEDCTHMLFIDSDIAFHKESLLHLLDADKDVISVPYPLKDMCWDKAIKMINEGKIKTADDVRLKAFYRYPMKVNDPKDIKINDGVIEVTHSPTGFMLIKRSVFDKMIKHYPDLNIKQNTLINGKLKEVPNMWNFFDTMHDPETKTYLGEDFAFCKLWRDIGGKCHAYILDSITHVGEHQYTGKFADELILDK